MFKSISVYLYFSASLKIFHNLLQEYGNAIEFLYIDLVPMDLTKLFLILIFLNYLNFYI